MKKLSKYLKKYLIRPIVYRVFVYLVLAALAAVLWDRFANIRGIYTARTRVAPLIGVFFLAVAWFRFLKLDHSGRQGNANPRKVPEKKSGSMLDFINTNPENAQELLDEEKDFCTLAAALICGIVSLAAAVI